MFRKVQQPKYVFGGKVGAGARPFGAKSKVRRGGGVMNHQALLGVGGPAPSPLEKSS